MTVIRQVNTRSEDPVDMKRASKLYFHSIRHEYGTRYDGESLM